MNVIHAKCKQTLGQIIFVKNYYFDRRKWNIKTTPIIIIPFSSNVKKIEPNQYRDFFLPVLYYNLITQLGELI